MHLPPPSPVRILRLADVLKRRGDSRSKLYADITDGLFPKPVAIGKRAVGWPEAEVDTLLRARVSGQSESQIKELVERTLNARRCIAGGCNV